MALDAYINTIEEKIDVKITYSVVLHKTERSFGNFTFSGPHWVMECYLPRLPHDHTRITEKCMYLKLYVFVFDLDE